MTELATVQNISTGPVLINPEGQTLGAGEFGVAAVRTEHVRDLINAGLVAEVTAAPTRGADVDRAYTGATRELERLNAEQADRDRDRETPADDRPRRASRATTEES